ncbi:MAG TPA: hypothetical protein VEP90_21760 [Methylomirabilota bacterium]|nr:hypothetical protein [Methylomirabilota bacterium]
MPNPYSSPPEATIQAGSQGGGSRPEPYSSPSSARAPMVSPPEGAHDHRAFTKGVSKVTRQNIGKAGAKSSKGFIGGTPAKRKPKKRGKK